MYMTFVQFISEYRVFYYELEIEHGRFYNIPRNKIFCSLAQIEDSF